LANHRLISPLGTIDNIIMGYDPAGRPLLGVGRVGMQSDHFHFRDNLSVDKAETEVEGVVRLLATKLAATVEALIRQVSLHGTPFCYDLFKLSDGALNLQTFYCVKGYEPTVDDPTGSITGWFAYKLFFTVQH